MVSIFKNLAGTISNTFRIGIRGPLLSWGTTDPATAAAASQAATKQPTYPGDLYVQTGGKSKVFIAQSDGWSDLSRADFQAKIVTSTSYICTGTESFVGISTNAPTVITLTTGHYGDKIVIKDISGTASPSNTLSINAASSQTIDGKPGYTISSTYGSLRLVYVSEWHII